MGLSTHVSGNYGSGTQPASVWKGVKQYSDSVDDRFVGSYTNSSDRTSKTGALITAGKTNLLGFISGTGLGAYFSGAWRKVPIKDVDYVVGIADGSTDNNGLFGFTHNLNALNASLQLTFENANPGNGAFDAIEARLGWGIMARDPNQIVVRCWNQDTFAIYANTAFRFHYRVEKF